MLWGVLRPIEITAVPGLPRDLAQAGWWPRRGGWGDVTQKDATRSS